MNGKSIRSSGFTLLELLIAIAIVLALGAILFVSTKGITDKSHTASCVGRLRQVGAAIHLYAGEHNNTLPGPLTSQSFVPAYKESVNLETGDNGLFYFIWRYLGLSSPGPGIHLARAGVCPAAERGKSDGYLMNSKFFATSVHRSNAEVGVPYPNLLELPPPSGDPFARNYPLGYYSKLHNIRLMPWKISIVPSPGKFALLGEQPGNVKNTLRYTSSENPPDLDMHCNFLFLDGHVETFTQRSFAASP